MSGSIQKVAVFAACALIPCAQAEDLHLDEAPAQPGEWGFRPAAGEASPVTPPAFVWRPQTGAATYALQVSHTAAFADLTYEATDFAFPCHCPATVFPAGDYYWRFRYVSREGAPSAWSQARPFSIPAGAHELPMPGRQELLARIPTSHPRLFIRPEQMPELRGLAAGELKPIYERLVASCEKLVGSPPPTAEPPKYAADMERGSDPWRRVWWGNRTYTIAALNGAATLAFTRLLGGKEEYGQLARRLLLDCAEWDPRGATGYRYNDEAGMPYAYHFARTYTFVHDLLSDSERATCRQVMTVRGDEMYRHLCPAHLWKPYSSHSNRAWHFLGEVGIAFLDEIPAAGDWVWFATSVFFNAYPVWADADGGWHEGASYWSSYIDRFLWWADVMRAALDIDAYRKPYFSQIGYYPLYLQPPGTPGGGFGDLTETRQSKSNVGLMSVLAAQAGNPYWQWYVDAHGGAPAPGAYDDFVRGLLPKVTPRPPTDLPTSRCFQGTGQAVLNTDLSAAASNVELVFKSSPFGGQSHGYDAQNAFLLYAFGERLLISTGRRDSYGSEHHRKWMWETKSVNSITVGGQGQVPHSAAARGEITAFHTSPELDFVVGEAGRAYGERLQRFRRSILFVKPEFIVIYDQLEAPAPATFEWRLHAPTEMLVNDRGDVCVQNGGAACRVSFLAPSDLKLSVTDRFDTPPRPRIKLTEWHLTAATPQAAATAEFVTVIRPYRVAETAPTAATLSKAPAGYVLHAELNHGTVAVLLRAQPGPFTDGQLDCAGAVAAVVRDARGAVGVTFQHR